jgi:hypothetical protein
MDRAGHLHSYRMKRTRQLHTVTGRTGRDTLRLLQGGQEINNYIIVEVTNSNVLTYNFITKLQNLYQSNGLLSDQNTAQSVTEITQKQGTYTVGQYAKKVL